MNFSRDKTLRDIEDSFAISPPEIKRIIRDFHSEMKKGLSNRKSSLKMIPTYADMPNGDEKGRFLALDLGGTNFRVSALELAGNRRIKKSSSKKFVLKKKHITGSGKVFFDFIARCIKNFMKKYDIDTRGRSNIGFTFSFPIKKKNIASGVLLRWTKGFSASGVEGKDVVRLLDEALARNGLSNAKIVAIANDTVSTLVAKSYEDPHCDVGVILGTGTNACYCESIRNIHKPKGKRRGSGNMLINTEWGNFNKLRLTRYDIELDRHSANPGEQILEKMVSGMYLGELVRLVTKHLIGKGLIFGGRSGHIFDRERSFKTEYVSMIEGDATKKLSRINTFLKKMGIANSKYADRKLLKRISFTVTTRAARIAAAAVGAVATKRDPRLLRKHTIAVDGSVFEKNPGFSGNIKKTLKEIFKKKAGNIRLSLTKDASGMGAAILAAVNSA